MITNKKLLTILTLLVLLSLCSSSFLIKNIRDTSYLVNTLQKEQLRFAELNEFLYELNLISITLGDYILFKDEAQLKRYYQLQTNLLKDEAILYEPENIERNKLVLDFLENYQAYLSFVESRVLNESNGLEKGLIFKENEEYAKSLRNKVNTIINSYQQDMSAFSKVLDSKSTTIEYLVFFVLVSALFLTPYVLYLILKPTIKKGLYLNYCFNNADSSLLFVNNAGIVQDLNKAAQDLFELFPESILNKNIDKLPEEFPHLQRITLPLFHTLLQQEEQLKVRVSVYKDGRPVELSADYIPVLFFNRQIGALLMARPATAPKDNPLLLDTLEKERKRISIEIHDWIARYMSTIIHSLDFTLRLHQNRDLKDQELLLQRLSDLRNHCQNAAIEMRGIMNDIHPYLIDKVGLISALESYINTFEKLNSIRVFIFYQDRSLRIKKKDEIIIYRIIQEALSNIVKHAQATEVDINFTLENDILIIEIMDNGVTSGDFVAGKGLWGMRERAALIGAEIHFGYSETGFCVTLTVPILTGGDKDGDN